MRRRLRRCVPEYERLLVLIDDMGGYLASDDPAEQALLQLEDYNLLGPLADRPHRSGSNGDFYELSCFLIILISKSRINISREL